MRHGQGKGREGKGRGSEAGNGLELAWDDELSEGEVERGYAKRRVGASGRSEPTQSRVGVAVALR